MHSTKLNIANNKKKKVQFFFKFHCDLKNCKTMSDCIQNFHPLGVVFNVHTSHRGGIFTLNSKKSINNRRIERIEDIIGHKSSKFKQLSILQLTLYFTTTKRGRNIQYIFSDYLAPHMHIYVWMNVYLTLMLFCFQNFYPLFCGSWNRVILANKAFPFKQSKVKFWIGSLQPFYLLFHGNAVRIIFPMIQIKFNTLMSIFMLHCPYIEGNDPAVLALMST